MAPTILETTLSIISEYASEDWRDKESAAKLAAVLGLAIGEYCEVLGCDEEIDDRSYFAIRAHLGKMKANVSSQLADDALALAYFNGTVDSLDMVVLSLGSSHRARLERKARAERLTPKIASIQSALRGNHEPGSMEIRPVAVKQICEILEYDINSIHFANDLAPMPNSHYASRLQLDLMWFASNSHIDETVPFAVGWAFADELVS